MREIHKPYDAKMGKTIEVVKNDFASVKLHIFPDLMLWRALPCQGFGDWVLGVEGSGSLSSIYPSICKDNNIPL